MLRVTVELQSAIDASRNRNYGTIEIVNVGGTPARGVYDVSLIKNGVTLRRGRIPDFRRDRPVWALVRLAMKELRLP